MLVPISAQNNMADRSDEDEEPDDIHRDPVALFSDFADKNIRLVKSLSWFMAGAGIIVLLRNIYAFKKFTTVSDIPAEFIRKGISLRGEVKKVGKDSSLHVLHVPPFKRFWSSSISTSGEDTPLVPVDLAGVESREGSSQWLNKHVLSTVIRFMPLNVNEAKKLECIAYKKGWLTSVCINEELVRHGVAVTCHNPALLGKEHYERLVQRLLRAEMTAEKKGRGMWVKPSLKDRLMSAAVFSPLSWMKTRIFGVKELITEDERSPLFSKKNDKSS